MDAYVDGRPIPSSLEALDQARLGEARRGLCEVLLGLDFGQRKGLTLLDGRKHPIGILVLGIVPALAVEPEESVERHGRAGRPQAHQSVRGREVGRHLIEAGRFHLTRHGALPDELVEPPLVRVQVTGHVGRAAEDVGRANGLVRLLSVLRLGLVRARRGRAIGGAELPFDQAPTGGDRLVGHLHAVGAQVGDEADGLAADGHPFVEPLRHLHGAPCLHAELARRFLLQGRGGERRGGMAARLLPRHAPDGVGPRLYALDRGPCGGFVGERHLVQLPAVEMGELGHHRGAPGGAEDSAHAPVLAGDEVLDVRFPLANQPERHRLDAAGGAAAGQLAPQHRRKREADEIIQGAPRQISLDEFPVQLARGAERVEHRLPGDLVEDDPLHVESVEGSPFVEHLQHVPGDRLAFPVGVRGKEEAVGAFERLRQRADVLLGLGLQLPIHGEVVVGTHGPVLGRQVTDMAVAGHDPILRPQVLVDRFGLGRGFDDDDVGHEIRITVPPAVTPGFQGGAPAGPPSPARAAPWTPRPGTIGSNG